MKKSFWLEDVGDYTSRASLKGDRKTDVCIIGAGFTGLSTAIHLKEKDPSLDVTIVESGVVGVGASGRNAGFSMRLFGITMDITRLRHGKQRTKEADAYMVDAVEYLEKMIERYDIDCDYVRDGMMTVAANAQQLKSLEKEMKYAEEIGLKGFKWIDQEETRQLVHSPTYLAARYDEHCALLHPAKLVRGLAKVAEGLGVKIYENTTVTDVNIKEKMLMATNGTVRAGKILFATNAYSSFFPKLKKKQIPIYTYITLTEPLTEEQLQALNWEKRVGVEDFRNFLHYYRLTPDNRLLFGGGEAFYYYGNPLNRDKNETMNERLKQTISEVFPQLDGIQFTHHWGGPISASLDLIPTIGTINEDIWYSIGCMGHGVSLTNYNGLTLSELMLGEETKRTDFFIVNRRILSIPPEPLRYAIVSGIRAVLRYEDKRGIRKAGQ